MPSANSIFGKIARFFRGGELLRAVVSPKVLETIGQERLDLIDRVVNNNVMVKLRQRQCRAQQPSESTAAYLKKSFCAEPFRTLETTHTGLAFVCCPVWLPTPIGTLDDDPVAMWDGAVARDVRASILDGSFRHCNHLHCPEITNRRLPSRDSAEARAVIEAYASNEAPRLPSNVNLSHDKSCNLSCPSCRSGLYLAKKQKQVQLDELSDRFVLPLLKDAETVMITGSGDPFASNHFRNIIKKLTPADYPRLRFNLITNGQLCDARAWQDLGLGDRVDNVHVSVDAATSDTYAFVRRLGDFARLRRNLAFLKTLRESGRIASLEFSMVVQTRNFREMPGLVDMAREFSADAVHFQMIRKRDIFSAREFAEAFVGAADHPEHDAFVDVVTGWESWARGGVPRIEIGNILEHIERSTMDRAKRAA